MTAIRVGVNRGVATFVAAVVVAFVVATALAAGTGAIVGCYDAKLGRFRAADGIPRCDVNERPARLVGEKVQLLNDASTAGAGSEVASVLVILAMVSAPGLVMVLLGILLLRGSRGVRPYAAVGAALTVAGIVMFVATWHLAGHIGFSR